MFATDVFLSKCLSVIFQRGAWHPSVKEVEHYESSLIITSSISENQEQLKPPSTFIYIIWLGTQTSARLVYNWNPGELIPLGVAYICIRFIRALCCLSLCKVTCSGSTTDACSKEPSAPSPPIEKTEIMKGSVFQFEGRASRCFFQVNDLIFSPFSGSGEGFGSIWQLRLDRDMWKSIEKQLQNWMFDVINAYLLMHIAYDLLIPGFNNFSQTNHEPWVAGGILRSNRGF